MTDSFECYLKFSEFSDKKKRSISHQLPVGANVKDLEMFSYSQDAAKEFLVLENSGTVEEHNRGASTNDVTGLKEESEQTPEISVPHLSASKPGINFEDLKGKLKIGLILLNTHTIQNQFSKWIK